MVWRGGGVLFDLRLLTFSLAFVIWMKKSKTISDKSVASLTWRSSHFKTKKRPPPNNNLLRVLRPKVYIVDSSSFKQLVQELTGKEQLNSSLLLPSLSSSLSSSPPPFPPIIKVEDIPTLSKDNPTSQVLPEMSPNANSIMSPPYDMDYVPFPSTIHKGFNFSYDIESLFMEVESMASVSTRHEMQPVDISVYNCDFS